jgi:hypothetical protein
MCRAILVGDCHVKVSVFAVSLICAISGRNRGPWVTPMGEDFSLCEASTRGALE